MRGVTTTFSNSVNIILASTGASKEPIGIHHIVGKLH